ncbi:MAG: ATP-binding protein [Chloroflexota bacterium]|nr:ATP-binding protein [Chloroflexota bacterium]
MTKNTETHSLGTDHHVFQKLPGQFRSIRIRLTGWYALTTSLILLLYSGLLYSTLEKMLPADDLHVELQSIASQITLMGGVILLVVTVSGYWLATKAMRPVRLMMKTARHIGQTNLSHRLQVKSRDELGELAITFNAMLNRLETAFSRMRQFTADASHELRTPLSTITIATNRVLSQWNTPQDSQQALEIIGAYRQELEIIQAEAQQMTRMVNALLTLARADTDQIILAREPIDVSEVILDVVERLAPLAHEYGIELSLGEVPAFPASGDRWYLASALTNLIENGLKYTAGIGKRVHIESGTDGDGWGWIRVQDDGPGIAEEHWPHLFERFYRIDPARSSTQDHGESAYQTPSSGSGLGLTLVEWVVQAHGGKVCLQSRVGDGSRFEVWLPLFREHQKIVQREDAH